MCNMITHTETHTHTYIYISNYLIHRNFDDWGFPGGTSDKEPTCQCRRHKRPGFHLCVGKIPWRRAWQLTAVFLPGESHGQRSLAAYIP